MNHAFRTFEKHGLIQEVLGPIPTGLIRPAIVVWARTTPKDQFRAMIHLARHLSPVPLHVYVDDVCSAAILRRTADAQAAVNEQYRGYFKTRGCAVSFSSELHCSAPGKQVTPSLLKLGAMVTVSEFLNGLPAGKRAGLATLDMSEMLHMLLELQLYEVARDECNLALIGRFSRAIGVLHRQITSCPLPFIVLPTLQAGAEVETYIQRLSTVD